ncbi:hypothetical protein J0S82_004120, partial [Galemys pyrenaicus]
TLESFNSSKSNPGQGRTAEVETAKEQSFLSRSCFYPLRKYLEAGAGLRPEIAVIVLSSSRSGFSVGSWLLQWLLWELQALSSGGSGSRAGRQLKLSPVSPQTTVRCRTPRFETDRNWKSPPCCGVSLPWTHGGASRWPFQPHSAFRPREDSSKATVHFFAANRTWGTKGQ